METVAIYKEERVKVYDITEKTDLALGILRFPANKIEFWGLRTIEFEDYIKRFELVTYHATDKSSTELHLLFDRKDSHNFCDKLKEWVKDEVSSELILRYPVDLLYLFGPHFQDRFGIVNIAFDVLRKHDIDILVSGCAGTSMYFVTSKNQGHSGLKILTDTFLIPTTI